MKNRITSLILFLGIVIGQITHADTWTPGQPKPACSPESWIYQVTGFFSDLWTYLVY